MSWRMNGRSFVNYIVTAATCRCAVIAVTCALEHIEGGICRGAPLPGCCRFGASFTTRSGERRLDELRQSVIVAGSEHSAARQGLLVPHVHPVLKLPEPAIRLESRLQYALACCSAAGALHLWLRMTNPMLDAQSSAPHGLQPQAVPWHQIQMATRKCTWPTSWPTA